MTSPKEALRGVGKDTIEVLLRHALGPQPYVVRQNAAHLVRLNVWLRRGLLRFDKRAAPRATMLTATGKDIVLQVLAAEADLLDPQALGLPIEGPEIQPEEPDPLPDAACERRTETESTE